MGGRVDIIMITYRSAGYVQRSLPQLLGTLGDDDRVWLWHNGDDEATIEALRPYRGDSRIARYHHSRQNVRLREPTNWLWMNSTARFVSKVDDDCLVAPGWLDTFTQAHADNPSFGIIGSWRHPAEDFRPELAYKKIRQFHGGHSLLLNLWVQGSGYVMNHGLVDVHGPLRTDESFTGFCIRAAAAGAINGFYHPFVPEDHMDDPRSAHTLIRTDDDLRNRMPLSAKANGVVTVAQWTTQLQQSALVLQTSSLDPRSYVGWRKRLKSARRRAQLVLGRPARW